MAASSVADVYHSIKAGLDIFKSTPQDTPDVPSKQVLVLAAEQVKTDAAKIGLMCAGGAPPADQQLSLATALQRSCVAFCIVCHAATAAAGPSLKDSLTKLAQDLVNPCLALVKDMGSGKDLKSHVGLVWERVSAVSKASVDNKACLFAALAKVMAVMQDTLREMEELQEEQQEEYGSPSRPEPAALPASNSSPSGDTAATTAAAPAVNGSSTQHEAAESSSTASTSATPQQQQREASSSSASKPSSKDADAVADLDFEAEEMSYWERQLLSASIQLLKASTAVVKAFGKALLQGDVLSAGTDRLDSWESCLWHTKHLRRAVEDLGAALYPTQDFEEVGSASLAVFEVTELMADECPEPEAVGAEQLSSLNQQLLAAHEEVQKLMQLATEQDSKQEQGDS